MKIVFYNASGEPIAYTEDGVHIYLFDGKPVAYIDRDSIYSYSGKHLGWYIDGWIKDNNGDCVFFTEEAKGGPVKPVKGVKPVKSVKQVKPVKSVKEVKPVRPVRSLSWSSVLSDAFFR